MVLLLPATLGVGSTVVTSTTADDGSAHVPLSARCVPDREETLVPTSVPPSSAPPERSRWEAWELTTAAVCASRRGMPRVTVLAALDQARASLRGEPLARVGELLRFACRLVDGGRARDPRVDSSFRAAAQELAAAARSPAPAPERADDVGPHRDPGSDV